ncbi:MAG TPA: MotA/TolQ/ExbB proton channel family protein [Spirochaetota bacterium]|jgi:biopolymer transport protein ExbB|nr:MotA/TolQ/ExbB proton channel family protein [Spirochaetota bacterium]OQA97132.1 MAG: Biopolymer transport protein ExbB [Spirochaetes bacterium ADurb.Bin218]HOK03068.1 MotA/TolQ/ExbB proton channel family protein [Spirochaetota bacterium]HOK93307.1 MotA/TolQ/ExbB proton channel family protein [Spirochaetota bacterium]HON16517.1 MotA/TolQ/ExbB proton channel family protein [Spirochaetota bacterium]
MENLLTLGERIIFTIMGLASVLALAVVIERGLIFRHNARIGEKIFNEIIGKLRSKEIQSLGIYMEQYPESVYARFAAFIKEHFSSGEKPLGHMMEGKIIEERMFLEKRIIILSSLGNNAPFIGLLGTVLGIIKAFYNLGTLGNTGAEVVMRSISTALLATACGLLIAIPVVMLNNYFSKRLKNVVQNLEILSKEALASAAKE